MGDLFSEAANRRLGSSAPLAQRLRPANLDEFAGQESVVGPGRALRLAIEQDRVPSMILYGPPGSGKTTLARIVAQTTGAEFEELSAVSATVGNAHGSGSVRAVAGRSCSWTRSTASTRRSRMRCFRASRKGS
jgi:replication-associated recombination protein RarA